MVWISQIGYLWATLTGLKMNLSPLWPHFWSVRLTFLRKHDFGCLNSRFQGCFTCHWLNWWHWSLLSHVNWHKHNWPWTMKSESTTNDANQRLICCITKSAQHDTCLMCTIVIGELCLHCPLWGKRKVAERELEILAGITWLAHFQSVHGRGTFSVHLYTLGLVHSLGASKSKSRLNYIM